MIEIPEQSGLVIVHVETYYKVDRIAAGIAEEASKYLSCGKKVYFLSDDSSSIHSELIPEELTPIMPHVRFIHSGFDTYETQMLKTKKILLADKISQPFLCGVAYSECISNLCYTLMGISNDEVDRDYMLKEAMELGWNEETFRCIFYYKMKPKVLKHLTDLVYCTNPK